MTPLLEVRDLVKEFSRPRALWGRGPAVRAVDGVSFRIETGETFGLVGESGSGKTTTARCAARLVEPTSGEVLFRGRNLLALSAGDLRRERRHIQFVFQDPFASLNPRMTAARSVEEPLLVHKEGDRRQRRDRVAELLSLVGLDPALGSRYPAQLSGGQRQRVGLARAIALNPALVVADEPVSSLDVSVQAQVVNLLLDLQDRLKLTYLFIAHDLRLVERICARVAVMYQGRIVEMGDTVSLYRSPAHPYTRALLSAVPVPDPAARPERVRWNGDDVNLSAPLREVEDGHFAAI